MGLPTGGRQFFLEEQRFFLSKKEGYCLKDIKWPNSFLSKRFGAVRFFCLHNPTRIIFLIHIGDSNTAK